MRLNKIVAAAIVAASLTAAGCGSSSSTVPAPPAPITTTTTTTTGNSSTTIQDVVAGTYPESMSSRSLQPGDWIVTFAKGGTNGTLTSKDGKLKSNFAATWVTGLANDPPNEYTGFVTIAGTGPCGKAGSFHYDYSPHTMIQDASGNPQYVSALELDARRQGASDSQCFGVIPTDSYDGMAVMNKS
jgi:hypothetical protein